ncbi:MAG: hypothetical protein IJQ58_02095, partial [Synergistaceae bacterium]|nr:hypothetical protein [Synergistaceae bacterium]
MTSIRAKSVTRRTIKLTSDIDITQYTDWKPIGGRDDSTFRNLPSNRFVGHFDGNGHTVNVDILRGNIGNAGLFGWVDDGGSIKNLSVSGSVEANVSGNPGGSHNIYVGGIASRLCEGTIENCNFDGTVKASNIGLVASYAGGITGYAGGEKIIITGCKVGSRSATSIGASGGMRGLYSYDGYEGGVIGFLYSNNEGDYLSSVTNNYANVALSGNCDHSGAIYGYRAGTKGTVSGNTSNDIPAPVPDPSGDIPAPVPTPKPEALNSIAQALGTTSDSVSYIASSDMAAPQAPTSRITNALAALSLDIISTQGSLSVSQSGYYAFPLTVPANLVGTNTELRVYLADRSVFGVSSFSPSAITKPLTTARIFTESGGTVTTLPGTIIAAADLAADTARTFSTHIVKARTA